MRTVKYVFWEEDGAWLGCLEEFPDYWTQGETLEDLKEHLRDLHADLSTGQISGIRDGNGQWSAWRLLDGSDSFVRTDNTGFQLLFLDPNHTWAVSS